MVCENKDGGFLGGLVNLGVGCDQYDSPGVYAKVSEFHGWILKNQIYYFNVLANFMLLKQQDKRRSVRNIFKQTK